MTEPKVSFIIPGFKCDDSIDQCIDSVFDQDYKNYEIVVVLNGQWDTKEELVKRLTNKYSDKILLQSIDHASLGNAFNYGINYTSGEVINPLGSDMYLMPGALRTKVESLIENPDCGFAYSGYRFITDDPTKVFLSHPFNRYHLECENYIDGAVAIWRKHWKTWNENLRSLIDYDWVLSITDDGTKGFYIKEPLFYAALPKKGGLSEDSNNNWIKRQKEIRQAHNIPNRDICITSLTSPYYALKLAEILGIDFKTNPGFKPHEYRLVYVWEFDCTDMNIQYNTSMFLNHFGNHLIHWTGKDIRSLCNLRWVDVDYYAQMVLKRVVNHYCLTQNDQKVLKRIGVDAELMYPPILFGEPSGKKEFTVSVNDEELKEQLAKAIPDYKFIYNDLSCGITVHVEDGVENIIRSIVNGNIVISNMAIPGVTHITGFTNVPELRKMLVHAIRKNIKYGKPESNEEIEHYKKVCDPKKFYEKLRRLADKKMHKYNRLEDINATA